MTRPKKEIIAFTGGGTGGHVYPAFPLIARLRAQGYGILWIGSQRGIERRLVEQEGIRFIGIPAGKWRRYFSLNNFVDLFRILAGFFMAWKILRQEKPTRLFSKGGFVSVPPVAAAKLLRIPTLTHESDANLGLATRINLKFGARLLLPYPAMLPQLPASVRFHAVVTGNPIRDAFFQGNPSEGRRLMGISPQNKKPLILVLGGSSGAQEINSLIAACLSDLLKIAIVVHQRGPDTLPVPLLEDYYPRPFFDKELPHLLAAAELAISRAGAGSIEELNAVATPAILIPLRVGSRGDQILNAALASERGTALVFEGKQEPQALKNLVLALLENPSQRAKMRQAAKKLTSRNVADTITKLIMDSQP